jgi:carboxymethylenebutenolidase
VRPESSGNPDAPTPPQHDEEDWSPATGTRRSFVISVLVAATTVASGVVAIKTLQGDTPPAAPVTTDTVGLAAGTVRVPAAGGAIPAYFARPASGGPLATVLLVHDSQGLTEQFCDLCRRLAKLGYAAIAPDFFARQGDVAAIRDYKERVARVISKVPDAAVMADLDAAAAYVRTSGNGDGRRLAMTGYGWGGRIAWLYAAHNPTLEAAVSWYAAARPSSPLRPKNPIDVIADLKCPVLALHGMADEIIPQADVVKRQTACVAQHKMCAYQYYRGVPHGFAIEGHRHYNSEAAHDGWARMLAWFKQYGAAPTVPTADI